MGDKLPIGSDLIGMRVISRLPLPIPVCDALHTALRASDPLTGSIVPFMSRRTRAGAGNASRGHVLLAIRADRGVAEQRRLLIPLQRLSVCAWFARSPRLSPA